MVGRRRQIPRLAWAAAVATTLAASMSVVPGLRVSAAGRHDGQAADRPQQKPAKKGAADKLSEPWPDAAKIEQQRIEAEERPLFASAEPLVITLTADFATINKIHEPDSPKRFPGVLEMPGEAGATTSVAVQLGSRGHLRLNPRTCSVVPLRVEFTKKDVKGSVFDGQKDLKLVTHCQNDSDFEQLVLAEYLAYRVFNLFTPLSFRARLVKATYVDSGRNNSRSTRYAMFIEHDDDIARRMKGRIIPVQNLLFRQLDQESLVTMALLQFMIGNTDYSIVRLHNIRLVQPQVGAFRPTTYDFDLAGLVNAPYAVPARGLGIATVRDRLYLGPCLSVEELEPWLAKFRDRQREVTALIESVPGLDKAHRQDATDYLNDFFSIVNSQSRTKRLLVDRCRRATGM